LQKFLVSVYIKYNTHNLFCQESYIKRGSAAKLTYERRQCFLFFVYLKALKQTHFLLPYKTLPKMYVPKWSSIYWLIPYKILLSSAKKVVTFLLSVMYHENQGRKLASIALSQTQFPFPELPLQRT
jgi:hypothetical protein